VAAQKKDVIGVLARKQVECFVSCVNFGFQLNENTTVSDIFEKQNASVSKLFF
jgi:hypothetical protein